VLITYLRTQYKPSKYFNLYLPSANTFSIPLSLIIRFQTPGLPKKDRSSTIPPSQATAHNIPQRQPFLNRPKVFGSLPYTYAYDINFLHHQCCRPKFNCGLVVLSMAIPEEFPALLAFLAYSEQGPVTYTADRYNLQWMRILQQQQ